jgi:hypothetical protein
MIMRQKEKKFMESAFCKTVSTLGFRADIKVVILKEPASGSEKYRLSAGIRWDPHFRLLS